MKINNKITQFKICPECFEQHEVVIENGTGSHVCGHTLLLATEGNRFMMAISHIPTSNSAQQAAFPLHCR